MCRRHFNAQISKNVQYSIIRVVYMMMYLILEIFVIYITFDNISLLGQVKELDRV